MGFLRGRLTTAAADKAAVFTEFMGETEGGEEARGRRRRMRRAGRREMWLLASTAAGRKKKKNDRAKCDHIVAHRNSTLRPSNNKKKTWNCHAAHPRRGFRTVHLTKGRNCMTRGGQEGKKKGGGQIRGMNYPDT